MIYLINKPIGITSFFAIKKLRTKFQIKKIGHSGTLDPLASGLLLVAINNSTRLIPYLEKQNKTYKFTLNLDGFTNTGDLDSDIIFLDKKILDKGRKNITKNKIEDVIKADFFGKIKQIPHKFSAIKIGGRRAYELSRENEKFSIPERDIEIFSYKILDFDFPSLTLEMEVSAGTYIRCIAEDLGIKLGLAGYITKLERIKIGHLYLDQSKELEEIKKEDFTDFKIIFPDILSIEFDPDNLKKIKNGTVLKNVFNLTEGKKYFIKNLDKYEALIEVNKQELKILASEVE